jgi:hypothetical protein
LGDTRWGELLGPFDVGPKPELVSIGLVAWTSGVKYRSEKTIKYGNSHHERLYQLQNIERTVGI